jgi:hypothetical protein
MALLLKIFQKSWLLQDSGVEKKIPMVVQILSFGENC